MYASQSAGEHIFPLESGRACYLPPKLFARESLRLAPVLFRSLAPLLTVLDAVTLHWFLKRAPSPINDSEAKPSLGLAVPNSPSATFHRITPNVEDEMKMKVISLCHLLQ